MAINIGYIQYSPEQYPGLAYAVNVNEDGTVVLGGTTGRGRDSGDGLKPETTYLSSSWRITAEQARKLAAMLISAADKSAAVKTATEEAKRMARQLAQANADRMAAIAAGDPAMKVHMTIELESEDS